MTSEETGGITAWREQACAFDSKCRNGFSEMALTASTFPGFRPSSGFVQTSPSPQKKSGRESLSPIFLRGGGRLYTGYCPFRPRENPGEKGDAQKGGRNEASATDDKFSPRPLLLRGCLNFSFPYLWSAYHVSLAVMYIRANNVIHFLSP